MFVIYGTNLGAAPVGGSSYTAAPLPLPATLAGTSISISITVNGSTVNAPMLFTLPSQVGAMMPSNTPIGTGTLTLTYNGNSASTPLTIVQSAFGISNIGVQDADNGIGSGQIAIATFGTNQSQIVTTAKSAAPGDTLILWGTGLGPTTVAGDSQGAPFGDIGPAPVVLVGGVQSPSVSYWGRSPGTAGLDQIVFVVPQNVPLGCNVGIVVETMNGSTPVVSNGPTLSFAATDGAPCSDPTQLFLTSLFSTTKTTERALLLGLDQSTSLNVPPSGAPATSITSNAKAELVQLDQAQLAQFVQQNLTAVNYNPSYGSCYTGFSNNPNATGPYAATFLNGGSAITLTPPSGTALTLSSLLAGVYQSGSTANALPGGTWTFSNGAGGSDVGPLTFTFALPAARDVDQRERNLHQPDRPGPAVDDYLDRRRRERLRRYPGFGAECGRNVVRRV